MAIGDDFTIDYDNLRVYHSANSTVYSALAFYQWLADTMDNSDVIMSYDDPMSAQTPTDFTVINGWFLDPDATKYLNGGSIQTNGYNGAIRLLTLASGGYTSAVAGDIGKTVTGGTTGDTGALLAYNNTTREWWVRMDDSGDLFDDDDEAITIASGTGAGSMSAVSVTGENLWANVYNIVGTMDSGAQVYVEQNGAVLTGWWSTGDVDLLILVKKAGTLIDSGYVTLYAREWGYKYDHWEIDLSGAGRNVASLSTSADLNNETEIATIQALGVSITFGTESKTLGGVTKDYDVVIDCDGESIAEVYEFLKAATVRGETDTLDGIQGQIWQSCDGAYAQVKEAPFGFFAGGKFFGARGVWVEDMDANDAQNYVLISSDGTTVTPPNVVAVQITSLVVGTRVCVAELDGVGGDIDKSKYTAASGNDTGNGTLVVKEAIENDTPASGTVIIGTDSYAYASWATSTFTLDSVTLADDYDEDAGVWVPFIAGLASGTSKSTTITYVADVPVLVRCRKYGYLPFSVEATISSTGLSIPAVLTDDGVVS